MSVSYGGQGKQIWNGCMLGFRRVNGINKIYLAASMTRGLRQAM